MTDVKPFPDDFKMIAAVPPNPTVEHLYRTCENPRPCTRQDCSMNNPDNLFFPQQACGLFEIAFKFPICWDGRSDSPDHKSHVAYTHDGTITGTCPPSHSFGRLPQLQIIVSILDYPGGEHIFADGTQWFHADFMNGWKSGHWDTLLQNCQATPFNPLDPDNPLCACEELLTIRPEMEVSDAPIWAVQPPPLDTQATITPEEFRVVQQLPRGACTGTLLPAGPSQPAVTPTAAPVAPVEPEDEPEEEPEEEFEEEDRRYLRSKK